MELINKTIEKYKKWIKMIKSKGISNNVGVRGYLVAKAYHGKPKTGKLFAVRGVKNLIVTAGLGEIAKLVGYNLNGTSFRYIQAGTGTTAATAGDTDIETKEGAKVAATVTNETTTVTDDTIRFVATISFTSSKAITEAAITNNSADATGELLARQVFSAINVNNGDSIEFTWDVVFAAA